jgi:hypothetical protein
MPLLALIAQDSATTTLDFDTPDFTLKLARASQALVSLQPRDAGSFDFAPADRAASRTADGFNALGDGLSNIDREGFAGTAFHSYPQNMRWDTYSGDYGPNFFGVAINAGAYVVNHPEFGWQAFGGNTRVDGDWIKVQPFDAFRQRVYIAPRGLWLTLDSGTFDNVEIHTKKHGVRIGLSRANAFTP